MKLILAKILAINLLFLSCAIFSYSEEIIFPKKKPALSSEIIEKKVSKNILLPKKKPIKLPIKKPKEKKSVLKEKEIKKVKGTIIPKSKPLIVKKSSSKIAKNLNILEKKIFYMQNKLSNSWKKENGGQQKKWQKKPVINQFIILYNGDIY